MNNKSAIGPQGTQVFEIDAINKMVAEEIANSQSSDANTPALIGLNGNLSGQQFILSKNKLDVGRRPSSDIVLNESSVSAMHAQIIKDGEHWKVLNLLSSNGTFVNGEKIVEKVIKIGDRIAFAEAEFVFTMVDQPIAETQPNKNITLIIVASSLIVAFAALLYFIL